MQRHRKSSSSPVKEDGGCQSNCCHWKLVFPPVPPDWNWETLRSGQWGGAGLFHAWVCDGRGETGSGETWPRALTVKSTPHQHLGVMQGHFLHFLRPRSCRWRGRVVGGFIAQTSFFLCSRTPEWRRLLYTPVSPVCNAELKRSKAWDQIFPFHL